VVRGVRVWFDGHYVEASSKTVTLNIGREGRDATFCDVSTPETYNDDQKHYAAEVQAARESFQKEMADYNAAVKTRQEADAKARREKQARDSERAKAQSKLDDEILKLIGTLSKEPAPGPSPNSPAAVAKAAEPAQPTPAQPRTPNDAQPSAATATNVVGQETSPSAPVEVPSFEIVDDIDLAPKSGRRIFVNVKDPDLTDAQCAAIIARLRLRAGREGQVAVRIPLHNDRPEHHGGVPASKQEHFFPLCYDDLDGKGVQEGTARQMQRAFEKKPSGRGVK
jgi:hypothetical protein